MLPHMETSLGHFVCVLPSALCFFYLPLLAELLQVVRDVHGSGRVQSRGGLLKRISISKVQQIYSLIFICTFTEYMGRVLSCLKSHLESLMTSNDGTELTSS